MYTHNIFVEQTKDEFFEEHGSILTEIDMMFSRPDYLRIVSQVLNQAHLTWLGWNSQVHKNQRFSILKEVYAINRWYQITQEPQQTYALYISDVPTIYFKYWTNWIHVIIIW